MPLSGRERNASFSVVLRNSRVFHISVSKSKHERKFRQLIIDGSSFIAGNTALCTTEVMIDSESFIIYFSLIEQNFDFHIHVHILHQDIEYFIYIIDSH